MNIPTESRLTVRERLALEAKKSVSNGDGLPLKNGNGIYRNGNGSNGEKKNGHHRNGTGDPLRLVYQKLNVREYRGKRLVDLFLGSLLLIGFLILTPFIALGIKLSSRGPVFFKQKRTGKNGITFTCYKFRTMEYGSGEKKAAVPDITVRGDKRVFPFGSFLRFLNLDELPQIINVIKGDMSLVGPRPYPVDECAYWNTKIDNFYYRYAVKPGITGFAQVKGYRGGTLDIDLIRKRTDYDLIYVQKNSLVFDLKTIAMTATQMVNLKNNGH